jgi:hypothetical protein
MPWRKEILLSGTSTSDALVHNPGSHQKIDKLLAVFLNFIYRVVIGIFYGKQFHTFSVAAVQDCQGI